jgi:DNA-binding CsgD family transcriptional regulator
MTFLDDDELSVLRQAAGRLGRPASRFDHAGLVRLGGRLGALKVHLIAPDGDAPPLVVIERRAGASSGPFTTLSERERQVAALIGRGLTNQQIAQELWISVATVKDHVHHILAKTGLANRAAVAGLMP